MAQQDIIIGTQDAKGGDTLFSAFTKVQANTAELYGLVDSSKIANRIVVNEFADFPEPLLPDIQYYIGDQVALPDTLPASWGDLPNNIEFKGSVVSSKITYNGTGDLFSGGDMGRFRVDGVLIDAPNARIYNIADTTGATIVNLVTASIERCGSFGAINVFGLLVDSINIASAGNGIVTGDKAMVLSLSRITMNSVSASFVGLDISLSTIETMEAENLRMSAPAGAIGIKGLTNSANIVAGQIGQIQSCEFLGGMTDLSGISPDDIRYLFSGNSPTPDTIRDALLYSQSSDTTTIATGGVYVKVNATWGVETISGFVADSTGRMTWKGERPKKVPVDMSLSIAPVTGTNKTIRTRVAVNGVAVANSERTTRTDSGDASSITTPWQLTFQPDDYVEPFVTSDDGTNVICSSGILRIN